MPAISKIILLITVCLSDPPPAQQSFGNPLRAVFMKIETFFCYGEAYLFFVDKAMPFLKVDAIIGNQARMDDAISA